MVYFGLGAALAGMFMLIIGWQNGLKDKLTVRGLITLVAGLSILAGCDAFSDVDGNPSMIVQGFELLLGVIVWFVSDYKNGAGERQKKAEVIGATALDRFFVECALAEANDFSKPKNVQRAKLLAD